MFSLFKKTFLPFDLSSFDNSTLTTSLIKLAVHESEHILILLPNISKQEELKVRLECITAVFSIILCFYDDISLTEKSGLLALHYGALTEKTLLPVLKEEIHAEFLSYNQYCSDRIQYYRNEVFKLLNDSDYIPLALSITLFKKPIKRIPTTFTGFEYIINKQYLNVGDYQLAFKLKGLLSKLIPTVYIQLKSANK